MKKGQGISINVVVIAAIALIILVIMVLLVINSGKKVTDTAGEKSCLSQGGECRLVSECDGSPDDDFTEVAVGTPQCAAQKTGTACCRYNFGG